MIQSGEVAKAYASYKHSLGDTAKNFKKAISRETDHLLTIDDILDELSMIRRVHGERTSICRDLLERLRLHDQPLVVEVRDRVEQLTQKQRTKLIRLEEDAQRIRKSVRQLARTLPICIADSVPACDTPGLATTSSSY